MYHHVQIVQENAQYRLVLTMVFQLMPMWGFSAGKDVFVDNTNGSDIIMTEDVSNSDDGAEEVLSAQVEQSATASRFDLVENGDLRYTTGWGSLARYSAGTAAASQLDAYAYRPTGPPTVTRQLTQIIQISGSAEDVFVAAGWARATLYRSRMVRTGNSPSSWNSREAVRLRPRRSDPVQA